MRTIIGALVLLVGLQLLLTQAGVANVPNIGDWWPVLIIAVGLLSWRSNPRMFLWPLAVTAFGVVLLLQTLGVLGGNAWEYLWPGLIILFGVSILLGRRMEDRGTAGSGRNLFTAFSGRTEKVAGPFREAQASAWFGGIKLDLREADIADGATIEVYAAFGGVEILVPSSITVKTAVTPLFGGAENKTNPDIGTTKQLRVIGTVLFGGVEVKN